MEKRMISVVVIPGSGHAGGMKETLESLAGQRDKDNFEYEVIAVSDEDTAGPAPRVVCPAAALNRGIRRSSGGIIALTSSDVVLDSRWLAGIWQCFQETECDAMGGRVLPLYPKETPSWARRCKYIMSGPQGFHDYGYETGYYDNRLMAPFSRLNCALTRESIAAWGMFDETLPFSRLMAGEDRDIFKRFERGGARIVYCGQVLAYHPIEKRTMTYAYLARWFMDYGRYCARRRTSQKGTYCRGIPLWKLKILSRHMLLLLLNLFDRRGFFEYWQAVFAQIGEICEYRSYRNAQREHHHPDL